MAQDWCQTLGRHLGVGGAPEEQRYRRGRRYAVARRLAGLFDAYATNRPAMLADWMQGLDTDGLGAPLPGDLLWQAELWRRVSDLVEGLDPVARREAAVSRLKADVGAVSLPERVSLFGPTRLPSGHLEVLSALAIHRDVHLWLPHPSPALWDRLAETLPDRSRRSDRTVTAAHHPLLASLGRDAREFQLTLNAATHVDLYHGPELAIADDAARGAAAQHLR